MDTKRFMPGALVVGAGGVLLGAGAVPAAEMGESVVVFYPCPPCMNAPEGPGRSHNDPEAPLGPSSALAQQFTLSTSTATAVTSYALPRS